MLRIAVPESPLFWRYDDGMVAPFLYRRVCVRRVTSKTAVLACLSLNGRHRPWLFQRVPVFFIRDARLLVQTWERFVMTVEGGGLFWC